MAFDETAIFPTRIAKGSKGGPAMAADVIALDAGIDEVVVRWPAALRRYDVGHGLDYFAQLRTVHDFWMARDGVGRGFRFKDWFDYTTKAAEPDKHIGAHTKDDQTIGTGDASETDFQLLKVYTDGIRTVTRNIRKPISGTVLVALDGSLQTETTHYTVDYSTGLISFVAAPGTDVVITAGCQFHVPCRFGAEAADGLMVSHDAFKAGSIPNIPILEMAGDVVTPDFAYQGGSSEQTITVNTLFDWGMGQAVRWVPNAGSLVVILPDISDLPEGGPLLHFINGHGSNSLSFVNRVSAASEFTLAAGQAALVYHYNLSGTPSWVALKGTT